MDMQPRAPWVKGNNTSEPKECITQDICPCAAQNASRSWWLFVHHKMFGSLGLNRRHHHWDNSRSPRGWINMEPPPPRTWQCDGNGERVWYVILGSFGCCMWQQIQYDGIISGSVWWPTNCSNLWKTFCEGDCPNIFFVRILRFMFRPRHQTLFRWCKSTTCQSNRWCSVI